MSVRRLIPTRSRKNLAAFPDCRRSFAPLGQFPWNKIVVQRPTPGSKPKTSILYTIKAASTYLLFFVSISLSIDASAMTSISSLAQKRLTKTQIC
jgi:hypothetical protein